ncbi:hypothetical protein FF38_00591 [Lucilia cuprina]|uniref:Uncharacterized protein n=1 Tax=Lucilia cuprina TaxID=7375 RepID=A0A0L0BN04_LUCCU|nr:hypothetical protein FF38_00591 [Lucilia cuprina]
MKCQLNQQQKQHNKAKQIRVNTSIKAQHYENAKNFYYLKINNSAKRFSSCPVIGPLQEPQYRFQNHLNEFNSLKVSILDFRRISSRSCLILSVGRFNILFKLIYFQWNPCTRSPSNAFAIKYYNHVAWYSIVQTLEEYYIKTLYLLISPYSLTAV